MDKNVFVNTRGGVAIRIPQLPHKMMGFNNDFDGIAEPTCIGCGNNLDRSLFCSSECKDKFIKKKSMLLDNSKEILSLIDKMESIIIELNGIDIEEKLEELNVKKERAELEHKLLNDLIKVCTEGL